ncbi:hypothetical protein [Nocardia salmonicida]|uniref:hypothetical protein n=1 Tax=Nocardia salmonicida TaxID=53431 RepID=UPI002E2B7BF0|nr:hypothetical protein [Nocardia salmonicida]
MPHRHTVPPRAGRPSGMRADRHDPPQLRVEPATTRLAGSTPAPTGANSSHPPVAVPHPTPVQQLSPSTPARADTRSTWRRRTLFRLVGASAIGIPAVAVLAACAEDDTVHAPDPLAAQEIMARADAAAATAAIALAPQSNAALSTIATERTAHAEALRTEIDRVLGVYGDGTTPVHRTGVLTVPGPDGSPVSASEVETAAAQPTTVAQLRDQLVRSQQSAATLARTESGYRAGLLASISAACATQAGVLLT